jgi:hypothetical protein
MKWCALLISSDDDEHTTKPQPAAVIHPLMHARSRCEKPSWNLLEMAIDIKGKQSEDPFDDNSPGLIRRTEPEGTTTVGRILSHARGQLSSSHRTHVFTVGFYGEYARFVRFDRTAIVVSERFSYVNDTSLLVLYFRCFSSASPEMRG